MYPVYICIIVELFQETLSITTTRLLKNLLPTGCLWTALRSVEGFDHQQTLRELRKCYSSSDDDHTMEEDGDGDAFLSSIPEPIRGMLASKLAVQALGNMIWCSGLALFIHIGQVLTCESRYLRQLNIDKDILGMNNFNIYDPMKKGQGLTLDGQALAHLEVRRSIVRQE